MADRHPIIQKTIDALKELEEEIDRLDERSKEYDEKIRVEFDKRAGEFREMLKEGEASVNKLKEATAPEVEKFRDNLEFTLKALKHSFNYFRAQFRMREERNNRG